MVDVVVDGETFDRDEVVRALQQADSQVESRLVAQLTAEIAGSHPHVALELLSRAHEARIRGYLIKKYAMSDSDAREAWNDALMTLWQRHGRYSAARGSLRGWTYNHAVWAAQQIVRRNERWTRTDARDVEAEGSFELPEPMTSAELAAFKAAWASLSPAQQNVLRYSRIERLEYDEIAQQVYQGKVTEEALRQTVSRAARKFRSTYEAKLSHSAQRK